MEDKLDELKNDFYNFQREWKLFQNEFKNIKSELVEMRREMGVREGKILSDQMDNIEKRIERNDDLLTKVSRDTTSVRKLTEYNELNVKEIMKALSLIYRNVDELEQEVMNDTNKT